MITSPTGVITLTANSADNSATARSALRAVMSIE